MSDLFCKCVKNKTVFKNEEVVTELLKGNMGIISDIISSGYSFIIDMSTEARFHVLIYDGMSNRSIEHGSEDQLPIYAKFEKRLQEENSDLYRYYIDIKTREKEFFSKGKRPKVSYVDINGELHYFDNAFTQIPLNNVALKYVVTDVTDERYKELQEYIKDFIFKESYYMDMFVTMDQRDVNRKFPVEVDK